MRNTRPSRRTSLLGVDQLEPRQLLSTAPMSPHVAALEHHHHSMRAHHAAVVGPVHSAHHSGTDPATADPAAAVTMSATSTSFHTVAQFSNSTFLASARGPGF